MKFHLLLSFCALFVSTSGQLVVQQYPPQLVLNNGLTDSQTPIMAESGPKVSMTRHVTLADLLGRNSQVQIFSGLARDVDSVSRRFEEPRENSTVLAPENAVVTKLPRKPWEDADDYSALGADAYVGDEGKNRAQQNLKRFVEAHVVPQSPWAEGEQVETLAGSLIWYEKKDGGLVIQPGNIEVARVADKASNGEVWIIKGILNYPK
jgi:hypothetical protein